ncbi:MAG: hypothetical protein KGI54_16595 [Pseudomonadota bacterium]|nr:hypothetical protein [Pseudomonadota bacterium]
MPKSINVASYYPAWEDFLNLTPDPVAEATYTTPDLDTGYDSTSRVYSDISYVDGPGQSGTPVFGFSIDSWLTGQTDPGVYTDWTVGNLDFRYINGRMTLTPVAGQIPVISDFSYTVDTSPKIETVDNVNTAAGGTAVIFPTPFHLLPTVLATAAGAGMTSASATDITTTGCTLHGWTGSTDTGGLVNYTAQGE